MDTNNESIIDGHRTYFTDAEVHQFNVGRVNLHSMAFESGGRVCFSAEITVQSIQHGKTEGWGTTIFEGSLEELIAKLAPIPAIPLEAAPEPSVKG